MDIRDVIRSVKCTLTDEEKIKLAEAMGQATQRHQDAVETKKAAAKQLTADVDKQAGEINRLGTLLANGYELRDVECELALDHEADRATVTRKDTGEVIEDRALSPDERQMGFGI